MGKTWGPPGSYRPQMGPMLAPWILLLSGWSLYWNTALYIFSKSVLFSVVCSLLCLTWFCAVWFYITMTSKMDAIASQITSLTIDYSIVYSDADHRKHQSSASLAFVRGIHQGPVNSPHKWPVTRKMFPFDDVIMTQIHQSHKVLVFMPDGASGWISNCSALWCPTSYPRYIMWPIISMVCFHMKKVLSNWY